MEDNKEASFRFCQKCGHKCSIESVFCSKCGTRLEELEIKEEQNIQENMQKALKEDVNKEEQSTSKDTKQCPFCGQTIKAVAKKCRFCGKWLEERKNNNPIKIVLNNLYSHFRNINTEEGIKYAISIVLVVVVIMLTISVIKPQKAPNCENIETKRQLIEIFKRKSSVYSFIDEYSIQNIEVDTPVTLSYDKDIDRYYCKAKIIVNSVPDGLKNFNGYDIGKKFVSDWFEYNTQISEGKPVVLSEIVKYGKWVK